MKIVELIPLLIITWSFVSFTETKAIIRSSTLLESVPDVPTLPLKYHSLALILGTHLSEIYPTTLFPFIHTFSYDQFAVFPTVFQSVSTTQIPYSYESIYFETIDSEATREFITFPWSSEKTLVYEAYTISVEPSPQESVSFDPTYQNLHNTGNDPTSFTEEEFKKSLTVCGYCPEYIDVATLYPMIFDSLVLPNGQAFFSSKAELAMFLSHVYHESAGLQFTRELTCLNDGCPAVYRYPLFDSTRNNTFYYGRGYMQLSWSYNYRELSRSFFGDDRLLHFPEKVAEAPLNWLSALWFWRANVQWLPYIALGKFGYSTRAINPIECKDLEKETDPLAWSFFHDSELRKLMKHSALNSRYHPIDSVDKCPIDDLNNEYIASRSDIFPIVDKIRLNNTTTEDDLSLMDSSTCPLGNLCGSSNFTCEYNFNHSMINDDLRSFNGSNTATESPKIIDEKTVTMDEFERRKNANKRFKCYTNIIKAWDLDKIIDVDPTGCY